MAGFKNLAHFASAAWLLLASLARAAPSHELGDLEARQSIPKMVFAHFMVRSR